MPNKLFSIIITFYHISSVIDFSSEKYICSEGNKDSWYLQTEFSEHAQVRLQLTTSWFENQVLSLWAKQLKS